MLAVFKGGCALGILTVALACSDDGPAGGPADGGEPSAGGSRGGSGNRGGQNPGGDSGQNPSSGGRSGGVAGSMSMGEVVTYGETYDGGEFHLGPVDWQESQWHNACAPAGGYSSQIRQLEGDLLAGLWNGIPNVAGYCDACIFVTAETGKSALLRVVTYGDTSPNSIDVSPAAFDLLDSGEYPRAMSWQFAKCPDTGNVVYEF